DEQTPPLAAVRNSETTRRLTRPRAHPPRLRENYGQAKLSTRHSRAEERARRGLDPRLLRSTRTGRRAVRRVRALSVRHAERAAALQGADSQSYRREDEREHGLYLRRRLAQPRADLARPGRLPRRARQRSGRRGLFARREGAPRRELRGVGSAGQAGRERDGRAARRPTRPRRQRRVCRRAQRRELPRRVPTGKLAPRAVGPAVERVERTGVAACGVARAAVVVKTSRPFRGDSRRSLSAVFAARLNVFAIRLNVFAARLAGSAAAVRTSAAD